MTIRTLKDLSVDNIDVDTINIDDIKLDDELLELIEKKIWRTASGELIPVEKMDTSHIFNVLRCLTGKSNTRIPEGWNGKSRQQWIKIFEDELIKRGEI
jgi:hypothetical protein